MDTLILQGQYRWHCYFRQ